MPTEKQINDTLAKIAAETPGYIAASLVDLESGMTLGVKTVRPGFDLATASAYNAEMVKMKMKIITALALNTTVEDVLITLGDQIHVVRIVGSGTGPGASFVYLAVDRSQCNVAIVRNVLGKHIAAFA